MSLTALYPPDPVWNPIAMPTNLAGPMPLLASGGAAPQPEGWRLFFDQLYQAAPDALVVRAGGANAPFVLTNPVNLLNPEQSSITSFRRLADLPRNLPGLGSASTPYWVETITWTPSAPPRRERGLGFSATTNLGTRRQDLNLTAFANYRVGDLNDPLKVNGVSANIGMFGRVDDMLRWVATLPATRQRAALQGSLQAAARAAQGANLLVGFAWRATISQDPRTGQLSAVLSGGFKLDLPMLLAPTPGGRPPQVSPMSNLGNSDIARTNDRDSYFHGANPYALAAAARTPDGRYVNRGDSVLALAGDLQWLQGLRQVAKPGDTPIRTNDEAREVVERAIYVAERSHPIRQRQLQSSGDEPPAPMSPPDIERFNNLLVRLHQYGLNFGSVTIRQAAQAAAERADAPTLPSRERELVRQVFAGRMRGTSMAEPTTLLTLVRDAMMSTRSVHLAAVALAADILFTTDPMNTTGYFHRERVDNLVVGLKGRFDQVHGGTLAALGVTVPPGYTRSGGEQVALQRAIAYLTVALVKDNKPITGQNLYAQFQSLSTAERQALRRDVQGALNIGVLPMNGEPQPLDWVGGAVANSPQPLQGRLMRASTPEGQTFFFLRGDGSGYTLRDQRGALITDAARAEVRARQMITAGTATDLYPLSPRTLGPDPVPRREIGGVVVLGQPRLVETIDLPQTASHRREIRNLYEGLTESGRLVYWLDIPGTTPTLLRYANGRLIDAQLAAQTRARQLLNR